MKISVTMTARDLFQVAARIARAPNVKITLNAPENPL